MKKTKDHWYVYMLRCADDSLYTGITKDLERRVAEHNSGKRLSASYTRSRRPVTLVYQETCNTRSKAAKREHAIRQLSRQEKEAFL